MDVGIQGVDVKMLAEKEGEERAKKNECRRISYCISNKRW